MPYRSPSLKVQSLGSVFAALLTVKDRTFFATGQSADHAAQCVWLLAARELGADSVVS